jgi:uncharacterized protein YkwD
MAIFLAPAHASSPEGMMLAGIDDIRRANGLPALRDSPLLSGSARSYSLFMLRRDYFGHLSSVRTSDRFSLKGEILAFHRGWRPRVEWTLRRWMQAPSHRTVILHPGMRFAGAGMARGRLGRRPATTWTIHFGRL